MRFDRILIHSISYVFLAQILVAQENTDIPLPAQEQDSYQVGSEWGKKPVTLQSLDAADQAFVRAAKATVAVGRASAFYSDESSRYRKRSNLSVYEHENAPPRTST
jgi:hypothetical protein